MVDNVIGMLVGAAVERRDGDSGVKGALEGYVVEGAVKAVVPLAITFAIGWGVQYLARRALHAVNDEFATRQGA